jgi:hypothetical protein
MTTRYKLLCPICQTVRAVRWCNELETAFLACGHSRSTMLLPGQDNAVGLEDVIRGTLAARHAFPGVA